MFIPLKLKISAPPPKRATPKIGGSEGGFIALVVVLSLIVLALCTAVFILLRDHSPSDDERRNRRSHRYQAPAPNFDFKYSPAADMASATAPAPSVLDRLRRLIPGRKRSPEATRMRGWVQTAGDEWDDDVSDLRHGRKDTAYDGAPRDSPFRPPKGSYASAESASTVHFVEPEARKTSPAPPGLGGNTPRSQSPQPMEGYTPGDPAPRRPHPSSRPFSTESAQSMQSVQSVQSMRSLESGTRFIEGL
ncbi:hypothetical protein BD626DRAFT_565000 [Schizophyllum amplum]|uniref:Transmembrane protein n=1 Tax=Schizophyllum amplum TaxID=97359 RepID=A0A550CTM3_9AGAR|nr:hypothetical protein BD626DRAFT_565000 [Auriculariopsis ampla]